MANSSPTTPRGNFLTQVWDEATHEQRVLIMQALLDVMKKDRAASERRPGRQHGRLLKLVPRTHQVVDAQGGVR